MSSKHEPEPVLLTSDWVGNLRNKRSRERAGIHPRGGRIPVEGPFRVWQGEGGEGTVGSDGWVRRHSVREVNLELMEGRVVELALDATRPEGGEASPARQVVGFIEGMYSQFRLLLWPRDGVTIHTSEPRELADLTEAIDSLMALGGVTMLVSEDEAGRKHFNSGGRRGEVEQPDRSTGKRGRLVKARKRRVEITPLTDAAARAMSKRGRSEQDRKRPRKDN